MSIVSQLIFVTHIIASNCTPGTQSDASHVSIYIFDVYYYLYMRIDERRVIHVDAEDELEATAVSHCVDAKALFAQFDASRRAQARVCSCDHYAAQITAQKIAQKSELYFTIHKRMFGSGYRRLF